MTKVVGDWPLRQVLIFAAYGSRLVGGLIETILHLVLVLRDDGGGVV